ncbi:type IV pilin protein [Elongatibacter sediminis]|uniref:Type IV pilin protein n=1 Tax=Elongatibacter sediminis TaxID=3119006 RepID=A0AAW9RIP3_9GAMM
MSLIELVIATGLLAVLLGLAVPGYQRQALRAQRAAIIERLIEAAHCQERIRSRTFHFDTTRCLPANIGRQYRIRFEPENTVAATAFNVIAEPRGRQRADPCGSLSLHSTGNRSISGPDELRRRCWAGR